MRELGRPVWAGAIAALGMLLDRSTDSRRVTLSVYALSQAFVAAIGFARIRKLVPEALTKPRWCVAAHQCRLIAQVSPLRARQRSGQQHVIAFC